MRKIIFLFVLFPVSLLALANEPQIIPLWQNGAPGFEHRKNEPEQAKDWWVKNIHNPSITVYRPSPDTASDSAILIFPGGGHQELVFNPEGVEPAEYLSRLGITAIALKYRLGREKGSPYQPDIHARQDAYRAMRLIRSKAGEWNINPDKIGVMGFSAGGEVASMISYGDGNGDSASNDPIDRLNGKPNFQILIYPGPGWLPEKLDKTAPATFILTAIDDPCCAKPALKLLNMYYDLNLPVEAHFFAQGEHGFNMGNRSKLKSISSWPDRLRDWLYDTGRLSASENL